MTLLTDGKTSSFLFLFNKLKEFYGFNPSIVTCDFQISLRTALKTIFKDIKLYPYHYHYIRNIRSFLLKYFKYFKKISKYNIENAEEINKVNNENYSKRQNKNKNNKEEFYNLLSNFRITIYKF